ncbi:MAG: family 43 glycosylhydrolase, partial [Muribaculaceae bacterium]|nr:family 43 glycosylhydrolase [Muribaculaceae bacterium]
MKNSIRLLFFATVASGLPTLCSCGGREKNLDIVSDSIGCEILYADPTIYSENGKYYLAGTRSGEPMGFALLESDDLRTWKAVTPDSMMLRAGQNTFGSKGFWAPQIIKTDNGYWLSYTANEQTVLAAADSFPALFSQTDIK